MKKVNLFLCFLISMVTMLSCNKKDDFNYPAGKVGSSTLVFFPSITINGSNIMSISKGGTFTDPGATAILGTTSVPYTTSMTIGLTTAVGVYTIIYTASNAQGNTATAWRMVNVAPASVVSDPIASTNDLSGTYARTSNSVTSTWTKIATGVYWVENPGGATAGAGAHVVAVNYSGNTISIPAQNAPELGGNTSSTDEAYAPVPAPATYSWKIVNAGYGHALRTFVKQ